MSDSDVDLASKPEAWIQWGLHPAETAASEAARLERAGWDGVMVFDSQSLLIDPYVALALAATSTETLGLGVGVTNTVTRHPAVSAAAISSVHAASGGRAVIGVGRGNSALFALGMGPTRLSDFDRHLTQLGCYLRGQSVDMAAITHDSTTSSLDTVRKGDPQRTSCLSWLDQSLSPVPLEVAATGPKVLEIGARRGDRVSVSVGANLDRLAWAAEHVRKFYSAGVNPPQLSAYVSVVAHDDLAAACHFAAPEVAMHTHIMAMQSGSSIPMTERDKEIFYRVARAYDMNRHGDYGPQTEALTVEFVLDNAVVGDAHDCVKKLKEIVALGYQRLVFMMPIRAGAAVEKLLATVENEVIPELRDRVSLVQ